MSGFLVNLGEHLVGARLDRVELDERFQGVSRLLRVAGVAVATREVFTRGGLRGVEVDDALVKRDGILDLLGRHEEIGDPVDDLHVVKTISQCLLENGRGFLEVVVAFRRVVHGVRFDVERAQMQPIIGILALGLGGTVEQGRNLRGLAGSLVNLL